jgi:hypothetical protein
MFSHSCGAQKVYANPLRPGTYIYEVWATNTSGISRDYAVARFKIP